MTRTPEVETLPFTIPPDGSARAFLVPSPYRLARPAGGVDLVDAAATPAAAARAPVDVLQSAACTHKELYTSNALNCMDAWALLSTDWPRFSYIH